jgi:hypothetical protein
LRHSNRELFFCLGPAALFEGLDWIYAIDKASQKEEDLRVVASYLNIEIFEAIEPLGPDALMSSSDGYVYNLNSSFITLLAMTQESPTPMAKAFSPQGE